VSVTACAFGCHSKRAPQVCYPRTDLVIFANSQRGSSDDTRLTVGSLKRVRKIFPALVRQNECHILFGGPPAPSRRRPRSRNKRRIASNFQNAGQYRDDQNEASSLRSMHQSTRSTTTSTRVVTFAAETPRHDAKEFIVSGSCDETVDWVVASCHTRNRWSSWQGGHRNESRVFCTGIPSTTHQPVNELPHSKRQNPC